MYGASKSPNKRLLLDCQKRHSLATHETESHPNNAIKNWRSYFTAVTMTGSPPPQMKMDYPRISW